MSSVITTEPPRIAPPPGHIGPVTGPTWVSAREAEVLAALAGGRSNAQIARHLHISARLVESHASRRCASTASRTATSWPAWLGCRRPITGTSPHSQARAHRAAAQAELIGARFEHAHTLTLLSHR